MKRKGFTLVELLAVIVIMGIVLVLIVPSINGFRNQNKKKGYELYAESAVRAAKLYVEDKKTSLTAYPEWQGCVSIPYDTLIKADLLKPYAEKRYNCSALEVRVYRTKPETNKVDTKTLTFKYSLTCYDNKDHTKVFKKSTLDGGSCNAQPIS